MTSKHDRSATRIRGKAQRARHSPNQGAVEEWQWCELRLLPNGKCLGTESTLFGDVKQLINTLSLPSVPIHLSVGIKWPHPGIPDHLFARLKKALESELQQINIGKKAADNLGKDAGVHVMIVAEDVVHELEAQLADVENPLAFHRRRLQESLDRVGGALPVIAGRVTAIQRAIQVLDDRLKITTSSPQERPALEGRHIDKRTGMPYDQGNTDPSVVAEHETRDGPSPSPPEPEGPTMGDSSRADAQLLFETIKSFRAIRDRSRLDKLERALSLNVTSKKEPTIQEAQKLINRLGGKSFGSYEANQVVAQEIQGMLIDLEFRIACPKPGCQKAAMLYCTTGKGSKNGIFVFVHPRRGGQTRHGGLATLPPSISLIPAPNSPTPNNS